MTDKYTELAREVLAGYRPLMADTPNIYNALITQVAALLRRVAREQIEEDAGIAADLVITIPVGEFESGQAHTAKSIHSQIRSRAKELESE